MNEQDNYLEGIANAMSCVLAEVDKGEWMDKNGNPVTGSEAHGSLFFANTVAVTLMGSGREITHNDAKVIGDGVCVFITKMVEDDWVNSDDELILEICPPMRALGQTLKSLGILRNALRKAEHPEPKKLQAWHLAVVFISFFALVVALS